MLVKASRLPLLDVLGALVGLAVLLGLADAGLLLLRPGSGAAPAAWVLAQVAFYLAVLNGLAGMAAALALSLPLLLIRRSEFLVRHLADLVFALLGLAAVLAVGFVLVRKPTWAAIDLRLPALAGVVGLGLVELRFALARPARARLFAGPTLLAGLVLALVTASSLLLTRPSLSPGVLQALLEESVTGPRLAGTIRRLADRDGDGFPAVLCALDCDCNDRVAEINPAAVDPAGDGVDRDCSGHDGPGSAIAALGQAGQGAPGRALAADGLLPDSGAGSGSGSGSGSGPGSGLATVMPVEAQDDLPGPSRLVAAGPAAAGGPAGPGGAPPWSGAEPLSFVLITVDSLRADHMSAYGYERETSPHFDALASRGVLFEQVRAAGPMTRFSLPSLLAGKQFTELKRTGGAWPRFSADNRLLGARMSELGYFTGVTTSMFYFQRSFGLVDGFQVVDLKPATKYQDFHKHPTGDLVTDAGIRLLSRVPADSPFFLWLHYMDPHSDYVRHPDAPRFGLQPKDLYDGEIWYTDREIRRFLDALSASGRAERTMVIITSDHGEGLDREEDHGKIFHGQHLYDNLVRVPLLFVGPGLKPGRVSPPPVVGLIDLLPTILELAGAPPDPTLTSRSLVPLLTGGTLPVVPLFSEKATVQEPPQKAMILWPHKLIWNLGLNRFQRYQLELDPDERKDLFGQDPLLDQVLVDRFKEWRAKQLQEVAPLERL